MAVLIIGGGSAGMRHARIASRLGLGPVTLISKSAPEGAAEAVARTLETADLPGEFDFGIIASPASEHPRHIRQIADSGLPVLVEKPLAADLKVADDLLSASGALGIVRVAYNFRFDPGFNALCSLFDSRRFGHPLRLNAYAGQDLRSWRPGRDYRETVSAQRALGGGILLELSHEIDYLIRLAGAPVSVSGRAERISDLEIDVEDSADLDIGFESGIRCSLHLNMVRHPFRRFCEVIFSEGSAEWDLISRRVRVKGKECENWELLSDCSDLSPDFTYEVQMRAFSDLIREGADSESALATLSDAVKVLQVIEACRLSSEDGRREIQISDRS